MPIDLPQIRAVVAAARLGSFSRAADALNITQSALSRRIADIEAELNIVLFTRRARGVEPTDACHIFVRHAESALASLEKCRRAIEESEDLRNRAICLGVLENLLDDRLISACRQVMSQFASSEITFRPRVYSDEVSADLLTTATKFGLRYGRATEPHLDSQWIADDPISVVCSRDHPLARKASVTLEDLEQARWIGNAAQVDEPTAQNSEFPGAFQYGWTPFKTVPVFARLKLVSAGFGIGMVRKSFLGENARVYDLCELRIPILLSLPVFFVERSGDDLRPPEKELRESICASFQT